MRTNQKWGISHPVVLSSSTLAITCNKMLTKLKLKDWEWKKSQITFKYLGAIVSVLSHLSALLKQQTKTAQTLRSLKSEAGLTLASRKRGSVATLKGGLKRPCCSRSHPPKPLPPATQWTNHTEENWGVWSIAAAAHHAAPLEYWAAVQTSCRQPQWAPSFPSEPSLNWQPIGWETKTCYCF